VDEFDLWTRIPNLPILVWMPAWTTCSSAGGFSSFSGNQKQGLPIGCPMTKARLSKKMPKTELRFSSPEKIIFDTKKNCMRVAFGFTITLILDLPFCPKINYHAARLEPTTV
jgi:hypothetical protein